MVGGFVQHQHVWLLQHQFAEEQAGSFATGEDAGRLRSLLTGEQHLAQDSAQFFGDRCPVPLMQPLDRGHATLDQAAVVLREVANGSFMSPEDFAGVDEGSIVAAGLA